MTSPAIYINPDMFGPAISLLCCGLVAKRAVLFACLVTRLWPVLSVLLTEATTRDKSLLPVRILTSRM